MVLAKDHFGMAPIHRAVLMNKPETLAFLIDRFPETVNARDKVKYSVLSSPFELQLSNCCLTLRSCNYHLDETF